MAMFTLQSVLAFNFVFLVDKDVYLLAGLLTLFGAQLSSILEITIFKKQQKNV